MFQSPTKRVNTSKLVDFFSLERKGYFGFNPLQSGSTLQNSVATRVSLYAWLDVSIPYKAGQHFKNQPAHNRFDGFFVQFQSPTKRVNTSKSPSQLIGIWILRTFQSPTKRVNTSKVSKSRIAQNSLFWVSIPYKAGQHFKRFWHNGFTYAHDDLVSIPYKAGQHFKNSTP